MKKHYLGYALLFLVLSHWQCKHTKPPQTSSPWPESKTEVPDLIKELDQDIRAGIYGNTDELIILKEGKKVFHQKYEVDYQTASSGKRSALGCGYDACEDESEVNEYNYFHPDYHPWYKGREVHSLQSVTKSVSSTMIGIAIDKGQIKGLDEKVLSFFESYDLSKAEARFQEATLRDLLTMTLGMEWHENDRPFDSTNTTLQLEQSSNWIQFTLNQPMEAQPGKKWNYNSGASHLMSGIIKETTELFIHEYAEKNLFGPLGITDYYWKKDPQGHPDTEGGLYLAASDLAKIGQLYLNGGKWGNEQVLSSSWVEAATTAHVENVFPNGWDYGFQWWRLDKEETEIWAGLGFGGQYLMVVPGLNVIGVVNNWNVFGERPEGNIVRDFRDALIEAW